MYREQLNEQSGCVGFVSVHFKDSIIDILSRQNRGEVIQIDIVNTPLNNIQTNAKAIKQMIVKSILTCKM